jgi:hypothetical protein
VIKGLRWWPVLLLLCASTKSAAAVTLFLAEPYGHFGELNPTGHAAVYLPRICAADSPVVLRRCRRGETGVVISRYDGVAGFDWIAIPLMPYLYAVDHADQVPSVADANLVASLRNHYRLAHLRELIPDGPAGATSRGAWIQLIGAAYDRRIVAFTIETTERQDDELIHDLNARENTSRFHLLFRNCADFAKDILNGYYPKAVRRSLIADLGMTTPKQIAKSLVHYTTRHQELHLSTFLIPQIPGSRSPSTRARGVLESLVRSKKYLLPLIAVQPWLPPGLAAGYLTTGRFNPNRYTATAYDPTELEQYARLSSDRSHCCGSPD